MKKLLWLSSLLLFCCPVAWGSAAQKPLPVDAAFALSAKTFGTDTVLISWKIAPDHYLYRERLHFNVVTPSNANIGQVILPPGIPKEDNIFGKYQVYADAVTLSVPIVNANQTDTKLKVSYQGCSKAGYCYPPTTHVIAITFLTGKTVINPVPMRQSIAQPISQHNEGTINTQQERFLSLLQSKHFFTIILAFLGFGILLSFTPCVLPMLPILSGIILGHKEQMTTGKAFRLSVVYVLSMAITYAIAGMLVSMLGSSIQTYFQKPWVIILFSLVFVLLALSFFGFYQIKMPARLEEKISNISRHQKSGHYIGVAVMGCLATLIVSPCVTPALVGVLAYIGKTGNAFLGAIALFALGLGMGLPLILIGTTGGKLLPKAGMWMKTLENAFGVIFLGLTIWMLARILPAQFILLLWAILLIVTAIYLGAFSHKSDEIGWTKLWKGIGFVFFTYGILMLVGVAQGSSNPLHPLQLTNMLTFNNASTTPSSAPDSSLFAPISGLPQVQQAITLAKSQHKPVVLDFYASWCISCKEMEQSTFKDPNVRTALAKVIALQTDITANTVTDQTLMRYYQVIAPPTLLFFNANGEWLPHLTLVGKVDAKELVTQVNNL